MKIQQITLIGAGRVGTALARQFVAKGLQVQQVFSRQPHKAEALAQEIGAVACSNLQAVNANADAYIIAVKDDAIPEVAKTLSDILPDSALIAHSSGATPMAVFEGLFPNYGVFYPLQTFSADFPPDFEELPFCISGSSKENMELLTHLANEICPNVYPIDEQQRQCLHVAAVMVNNFTNYLFAAADNLCNTQGLDFELLRPLIRQTVRKIEHAAPHSVQTGPAARGDAGTIDRHLDWLLQHAAAYQPLYQQLSEAILESKAMTDHPK